MAVFLRTLEYYDGKNLSYFQSRGFRISYHLYICGLGHNLSAWPGILILTSNRVGTFDEAFKSRIQLSLQYENLSLSQRYKIWENFINRLESFEQSPHHPNHSETDSWSQPPAPLNLTVNVSELRENISALARYNMNGREIRNAVTTARQWALHKRKAMGIVELMHVISLADKFDAYLREVNENVDRDTIARDQGYR